MRSFEIVFFSILAALDLVVLFFQMRYLLRRNARRAWPETIGIIAETQIGYILNTSTDDYVYSANFTFNYKVPGSELHGKFSIQNFGGSSDFARKAIADHPVGTTLKVRYNPGEPGEYFTELDGPDTTFWFYFISFIIIFISLLFGVWYLFNYTT